jgi:TonB family protein
MKCLWPSTKVKTGNGTLLAAAVALLTLLSFAPGWCAVTPPSTTVPPHVPLAKLEKSLRRLPAHISEFAPVSEPLALPRCGNIRPPEALLTPDPLLRAKDDDLRVRVSFIVGTDGHVHSAFVLDSGGPDEDQIVLHAVRDWRYRPALCNGVPTDSEALIRFSVH